MDRIRGDIVDIDPTDAGFTSRGCEWTADLTPRITPGEPFGDGAWLVGSEVAPGLYVAAKPETPGTHNAWEMCRWKHLPHRGATARPGASASLGGIVEIGGDVGFRSMDCGEWKPYAEPAVAPGQPFGDGVFLVGAEIAPGSWRAVSPTDECQWERLREDGGSRFRGPYVGPGITLFFGGYGGWIAHIAPDDVGFASRGCGTWEPIPIASFGDGEHRVGADIPPGLYRASAPTEECEWERRDAGGVTGYGDSSIPIAEVALAHMIVIDKSERWAEPRDPVFASSGCGTWTNDPAPRISPGQPFGDGAWLVGSEVAPGRYRAIDPSESCRWLRVRGFRDPYRRGWFASGAWGGASPNIAGGDVTGVADVTSLDAAFVSRGCGAWTRDLQPITEPGEPFEDGTYIVGIDIAPGRYRAYPASAPEGSFACGWQRRSNFTSETGYTYGSLPLASGGGGEGMAVLTVDIAESDAGFHSEGCGTWTAELTPAATPGEPFGDGEWIVGLDIAPGRYRAHSPSDSCRWNRLSGFGGHSFLPHETDVWGRIEAIERSRDLDDPGEVTIAPSDVGFASRDCGAWTPVPP